MKKFVVETIVKEINDEVENILDTNQFVQEIEETINITETEIAASSSLSFQPMTGGKGAKSVKIISDIPIKMTYTSMADTFNFGCYMREITLLGDAKTGDSSSYFVANSGSITLQNADTEKSAKVKIIYTY